VIFEVSNEGGYSVSSPDLPGVVAAEATQDEAKQRMLEAIAKREAEKRQTRERAREQPDAGHAMVMNPDAA
jgi:predicted RNase H-like HicB family nuclease